MKMVLRTIERSLRSTLKTIENTRFAKNIFRHTGGTQLTSSWLRENNPAVRHTLLKTSIDECEVNPVYSGVLWTLANNTLGTCPKPTALIEHRNSRTAERIADAIEDKYMEWAVDRNIGLALRELRFKAAQTGLGIGIPYIAEDNDNPVKLKFTIIGKEYLSSPRESAYNEYIEDGIEFYPNGDIRAVWIRVEGQYEPERYPVEKILIYDKLRISRFWPECAPAFEVYPSLTRYIKNILTNAEVHSSIPLFMEPDRSTWPESLKYDEGQAFEYRPGMVPMLPPGVSLKSPSVQGLAEDRKSNSDLMQGYAARCINMPLAIAKMNSSDANMAVSQGDRQLWGDEVEINRFDFQPVLIKTFRFWYPFAVASGLLPRSTRSIPRPSVLFMYSVLFNHFDPQKRANAAKTRLECGATTLTRIYSDEGKNIRREIDRDCQVLGISRQEWLDRYLQGIKNGIEEDPNQEGEDE